MTKTVSPISTEPWMGTKKRGPSLMPSFARRCSKKPWKCEGAGYEFEIQELDVELWFSPECEPIDEAEFDAREYARSISPEARARQQQAAAAEAERAAREAVRDEQLKKAREEAMERIRAKQGKSAA